MTDLTFRPDDSVEPSYWIAAISHDPGEHQIEKAKDIDHQEFRAISKALRESLHYVAEREIKLVVMNQLSFHDFVEEVAGATLGLPTSEWPPMDTIDSGLRSEFFNWLLSVRMYNDHTQTRLTRRYGGSSAAEVQSFVDQCSSEFDNNPWYAFSYRLRNYVQHCGLPPLQAEVRGAIVAEEADEVREYVLDVSLDSQLLLDDFDGWGRIVKPWLQAQDPKIDASMVIDSTMESLHEIHSVVRAIELPYVLAQVAVVDAAREVAAELQGEPHLVEARIEAGEMQGMKLHPLRKFTVTNKRSGSSR